MIENNITSMMIDVNECDDKDEYDEKMDSKYVNTNERSGPSKGRRDYEKLQIRRGAGQKWNHSVSRPVLVMLLHKNHVHLIVFEKKIQTKKSLLKQ